MHHHLTTRGRRRGPRCMAALIAATLAGSALIPTAPAATPAGLAIMLTGPAAQVRSHSSVTYTATITNTTADLFTGRLVLTVPGYLTITASTGGTPTAHTVTWAIDVPAGRAVTRAVRARIGRIPPGILRVTSLATVHPGASTASPPLIRAAHGDTIAGVAAPPAATQLVHRIPHERGPACSSCFPSW